MNKKEFINLLAKKNYTKKAAEEIVKDVFETITEALANGEEVQFSGFGTFSVRDSKERNGTNVRTQEHIVIPGHRAPRFTPGKMLRRVVKEGFVRE